MVSARPNRADLVTPFGVAWSATTKAALAARGQAFSGQREHVQWWR